MNDHYFTAAPASPAERRTLTLRLAGHTVPMQTAPGVFCPDRLDQGTAVLLRQAPTPPPSGNFLDLGCGWGPVAVSLALHSPGAHITAVDVNQRSLDLCRTNAENNALSNIVATLPSQVEPATRFDLIWSNPPIRIGKSALHRLLLTWLPRLVVGGSAYLVVQRNLGSDSLQKWVISALGESYDVSRYTSERGFRILLVQRRADGGPEPLVAQDEATQPLS